MRSAILLTLLATMAHAFSPSFTAVGAVAAVVALVPAHVDAADYLPGVAMRSFALGEEVPLQANMLTSVKTQLAFDHYKLPFCRPDVLTPASENLGEILSGHRVVNTPYVVKMGAPEMCRVLCEREYTAEERAALRDAIDADYRAHFILDNMPSARRVFEARDLGEVRYEL